MCFPTHPSARTIAAAAVLREFEQRAQLQLGNFIHLEFAKSKMSVGPLWADAGGHELAVALQTAIIEVGYRSGRTKRACHVTRWSARRIGIRFE
jgi:hypothetical protein